MIANGGSRSNGAFFARHLMRADENERVTVTEMRGFAYAQDVREAFEEMRDLADGTRIKNFFYHANLNTRSDEHLTPEQWEQAADILERQLEFEGQPRFIVEHEKDGRTHRHIVWSRVCIEQDADNPEEVRLRAISDSHNFRRHELAAREMEQAFNLSPVESTLTRDKETTPRVERRPEDWASFRAQSSKIDPQAVKAELTELWQHSDSGPAFASALAERGYILARGDRRDFCVIDAAGDEHSLARRISGVKAAEIRSRMADVDASTLPSVAEGRGMARQHTEQPQDSGEAAPPAIAPTDPFSAVMAETTGTISRPVAMPEVTEAEPDAFAQVMAETVQRASAAPISEDDSSRYERFRAWWGGMRDYVAGMGQQARDFWHDHFRRDEPEAAPDQVPGNVVTQASLEVQQAPQQQQGMEPGL
ncbi:MAG: hypothetical protein EOP21_00385 [Hyphomicrobiales bacterium]|nr:MAG: hypothetical protein EOP21_00385 [Hyphomicrobiales bacterium]